MLRTVWATRVLLVTTILAGAWIAADLVSDLIGRSLEPEGAHATAPRSSAPVAMLAPDLEVITRRGLFGPQPELVTEGLGPIPAALTPCTLNISLIAVVPVVTGAARSLATFRTPEDGPLCVAVGEWIQPGVRLVDVYRESAVVQTGTQVCELQPGGALAPTATGPVAHPGATGTISAAEGVHCSGSRCTVDERVVRGLLTGGMDEAKNVYVTPFTKDGVTQGFLLRHIKSGTLLTHLGLQSGDVVTRVNGLEINSPGAALTAYQRFQNDRHFEVDILRSGRPQTLRYDVQ